jgi:hypothetical protein
MTRKEGQASAPCSLRSDQWRYGRKPLGTSPQTPFIGLGADVSFATIKWGLGPTAPAGPGQSPGRPS